MENNKVTNSISMCIKDNRGQSAIELAISLSLFFVILLGGYSLANLIYRQYQLDAACHQGAKAITQFADTLITQAELEEVARTRTLSAANTAGINWWDIDISTDVLTVGTNEFIRIRASIDTPLLFLNFAQFLRDMDWSDIPIPGTITGESIAHFRET